MQRIQKINVDDQIVRSIEVILSHAVSLLILETASCSFYL